MSHHFFGTTQLAFSMNMASMRICFQRLANGSQRQASSLSRPCTVRDGKKGPGCLLRMTRDSLWHYGLLSGVLHWRYIAGPSWANMEATQQQIMPFRYFKIHLRATSMLATSVETTTLNKHNIYIQHQQNRRAMAYLLIQNNQAIAEEHEKQQKKNEEEERQRLRRELLLFNWGAFCIAKQKGRHWEDQMVLVVMC